MSMTPGSRSPTRRSTPRAAYPSMVAGAHRRPRRLCARPPPGRGLAAVVVPRRGGRGGIGAPHWQGRGREAYTSRPRRVRPCCVTDSRHGRNTTGYDLRFRALRPSASIASNSSAEDGGLSGGSFDGRPAAAVQGLDGHPRGLGQRPPPDRDGRATPGRRRRRRVHGLVEGQLGVAPRRRQGGHLRQRVRGGLAARHHRTLAARASPRRSASTASRRFTS